MAIDFGRKRCGIAATDELRIVANPVETVSTPQLTEYVTRFIAEKNVDAVIVGNPTQMNGDPSESTRWLTPVINRLRKLIAPVPVILFDERFTSVLAHRAMIDGGIKKMQRRDKEVVDRISAAIILNDFLASQQASTI